MKQGARNFNTNRARNTGLSVRTPKVAKEELIKSSQVGNKAFFINSAKMALHKFTTDGRKCSCLDYTSPEQETYAIDSDIDTPVLILEEDNETIDDDMALDEAIEMLESPKDVCPICYGTSIVGNYACINCVEIFLDTTYKYKKLNGVGIEEGRPFYFEPLTNDASITFTILIPGLFDNFQRFSLMPKSTLLHSDIDTSKIFIGTHNGVLAPFNETNIELLAQNGKIDIEIPVVESTIAFFMRFECGDPTIFVNLPNISAEVESGEHDYFSSITVSVDATQKISTRDILADRNSHLLWRVTSVEKKEPMSIDLGKEVNMRKVRGFEAYSLIP